MNYSVYDSSLVPGAKASEAMRSKDNSLRVGIVREERELSDGSMRYVVEVHLDGRQVPVSCTVLTRFGGAHNFEEYRIRPWLKVNSGTLPPSTAGKYELRSGDTVLIAFINGTAREGVILGGLNHPSRKLRTQKGKIEYLSSFNGIETQVRSDGSYKLLFNGLPVNTPLLDVPSGTAVSAPQSNPLVAGSYFGFDANGSYVVSDGSDQWIKIYKSATTRAVVIVSGGNKLELGGNLVKGVTGLKTDELAMEASLNASLKANIGMTLQATQVSIKGVQIAIGSDQFELIDGLIQLVDALGSLAVTSPVGTCTPLMAAPTWAAQVLPLKIKMTLLKGSLKDAKAAEFSGDDSPELGSDIGS